MKHIAELDVVSESVTNRIPLNILNSLKHYVWFGQPPGDFVRAVLCNDLLSAIGRADEASLVAIKPICQYVYNALPSECHGSAQKVGCHIANGMQEKLIECVRK